MDRHRREPRTPTTQAREPSRRTFLACAAGSFALWDARLARGREINADPVFEKIRWLPFYGERADESILSNYDIVVLDGAFKGSLGQIAQRGAKICGYISLGEIRQSDPAFATLDSSIVLGDNPDWQGTRRIDVRKPSWADFVVERRIPELMSKGFTGLMLDTLDTPPYLEASDPVRCGGMRDAAVLLVRRIRSRWPQMMLIINRGYALLPDIVGELDAVVAESLMTCPKDGGFAWVDTHEVQLQMRLLQPARERRPPLAILSLDYWQPDDRDTIAEIYRRERAFGHHPYVGTRSLDHIVPGSS